MCQSYFLGAQRQCQCIYLLTRLCLSPTPVHPPPLSGALQAPSQLKWLFKGERIDSTLRIRRRGKASQMKQFLSGVM